MSVLIPLIAADEPRFVLRDAVNTASGRCRTADVGDCRSGVVIYVHVVRPLSYQTASPMFLDALSDLHSNTIE